MAEDYNSNYKRAKFITWRFSRTNKRNFQSGKQYYDTMYNEDISSRRQKELRKATLAYYKWLKSHRHMSITYKDVQQKAFAVTPEEKQFVSQYFQWLANRFGRV